MEGKSIREIRKDQYKQGCLKLMSQEIKILKEALKDKFQIDNDEELENWLIEEGYKEQ